MGKFKIGNRIIFEYKGIFNIKRYGIGTILLQSHNKAMINTSEGVFWMPKKILKIAK